MSILQNSNAISAGGYSVNNSVRLRSSASAYLSRTPASAGNRKTWTWSGWVKRGALGISGTIVTSRQNGQTDWLTTAFTSSDTLQVCRSNGGTYNLVTTQVFRDPSAWYHIVIAWDTTQATAANRVKLYINGNQVTAFGTANYPTLNYDGYFNTAVEQEMGAVWAVSSVTDYFDGYLADVNFIDGSAKTPSDFGETDATTGVWKPKAYTGSYGTNGFYLKFSDIATTSGSNAGLGKDFSGNANYWTTNNISVTSGTTYDAMTDVPTNTSATTANYCTLNPLRYGTGSGSTITISEANLRFTCTSNAGSIIGTMNIPSSGKWYWEAVVPTQTYNFMQVGVIKNQEALANLNSGVGYLSTGYAVYTYNGQKINNGSNATYMAVPAQNTVVTIAYDADTGSLYVGAGGSWANGSGSTNQTWANAVAAYTGITGDISPAVSFDSGNCIVNFGQRPFAYTPPTGFQALNTYNLPTPTILQGNKYMDATLWTGNGYPTSGTQSITNASLFKPDLVWIKIRSGAGSNTLTDSVRGVNSQLFSNQTAAQETNTDHVTAFNSNGFSLGTGSSGTYPSTNNNGSTYVGWQWQAGQGSTSSNTQGSITSTVSVSTTAGFSVVTYTGTGANATVGHGLGVAPKMIIAKGRGNVDNWPVYHASANASPATGHLLLNTTAAFTSTSSTWNNTAPTLNVFSVGTDTRINQNTIGYVAYCWAEISGFSKFGSFVGNSSTDGPFVYCGFRPRYILFKNVTSYDWHIFDAARNTYNLTNSSLKTNASTAEYTNNDVSIDLLSNGFKLRGTDLAINGPSNTIIFAAFAEHPFKSSLAR